MCGLTDHYVRREEWEHVGKLVLAQFCLGMNPARTPSGADGIRSLAEAQLPCGAVLRRSSAGRAGESTSTVEFFRKAYQATLVVALASLIISSAPA